jgi:hypothetical protein
MKKQITFESRYSTQEGNALDWLRNLSRCFFIKKIKMRSYERITKWDKKYCTQVEVEYE